jgi:catechol 2,3-dioxygenase-like lactoylglutathione lyase family enzyme
MIAGLNHTTFSVRDLESSFHFYTEVLGLKPIARWYKGAYLVAGADWVCLTLDPETRSGSLPEYTHTAFTVQPEEFEGMSRRLVDASVTTWQVNHSYGDSFYFLDPDGHKLEIHVSDLQSRIKDMTNKPPKDFILY